MDRARISQQLLTKRPPLDLSVELWKPSYTLSPATSEGENLSWMFTTLKREIAELLGHRAFVGWSRKGTSWERPSTVYLGILGSMTDIP